MSDTGAVITLTMQYCDVCKAHVRHVEVMETGAGDVCEHCLEEARARIPRARQRYAFHRIQEGQIVRSSNDQKAGFVPVIQAAITLAFEGRE